MKRLAILAAIVAAVIGLSALPVAGAKPRPAADSTAVKTQTVARAAANEIRAGERLRAPKLGRHVRRYQWLRCAVTGRKCASIRGATHRVYVVRAADVGHVLRVREVLQGDTVAVSQPTSVVGLPLPVNLSVPTILDGGQGGGTLSAPIVGDVLTGTNGTWSASAIRFTYQWQDCDASGLNCTPIVGATSQTYTIASSDVGHTIVFQVTAYNF